jgi:hypothetical protein
MLIKTVLLADEFCFLDADDFELITIVTRTITVVGTSPASIVREWIILPPMPDELQITEIVTKVNLQFSTKAAPPE